MALVIRMKIVTRLMLFIGSLLLWLVVFVLLNNSLLHVDELILIVAAVLVGALQTGVLAYALKT